MEISREEQGNQFPYAEDASRRWLERAWKTNQMLRAFMLLFMLKKIKWDGGSADIVISDISFIHAMMQIH